LRRWKKTCDRVAIKHGWIAAEVLIKDIEHTKEKTFEIKLVSAAQTESLAGQAFHFTEVNLEKTRVKVTIHDEQMNTLLRALSALNVVCISKIKYNLEQYFMHYYRKEDASNV
jgi:ABC-2 type transport system ATP-binding protein